MTIYPAPWDASTWGPGGCSASPRMAAAFPDESPVSASRQEGRAAHWYVSETLRGKTPTVGDTAPNGWMVDAEMAEGAALMIKDARQLMAVVQGTPLVETRVEMPEVGNFGDVDFGLVDAINRVVYVWEFKYGHRYIDVFERWQIVNYIPGVLRAAGLHLRDLPDGWTFDLRVYQPRSFHPNGPRKIWGPDLQRVLRLVKDLGTAHAEAQNPAAPMTTGAHCDLCPARASCDAFQRVAETGIDLSTEGVGNELSGVNATIALRKVRAARERLEAMETGLEAQIMAELRRGKTLPGVELEQGMGRETWAVPVEVVYATGDAAGVDLRKPAAAITPAQARKLGLDEAVTSAIAKRPKGDLKLKLTDDRAARRVFQP